MPPFQVQHGFSIHQRNWTYPVKVQSLGGVKSRPIVYRHFVPPDRILLADTSMTAMYLALSN